MRAVIQARKDIRAGWWPEGSRRVQLGREPPTPAPRSPEPGGEDTSREPAPPPRPAPLQPRR